MSERLVPSHCNGRTEMSVTKMGYHYNLNTLLACSFWLGWKQFGARYERSGRRLTGGRPGTCTPRSASEGRERSSSPVSSNTPGNDG